MLVFIHVLSVCVYIHLLYTCIIIVVYQWVRERATVTRPLLSVATASHCLAVAHHSCGSDSLISHSMWRYVCFGHRCVDNSACGSMKP